MSIILANNNVAPKNCSKISKYNFHTLLMKRTGKKIRAIIIIIIIIIKIIIKITKAQAYVMQDRVKKSSGNHL